MSALGNWFILYNSRNLPYFVRFSTTLLPPLGADVINGCPLRERIETESRGQSNFEVVPFFRAFSDDQTSDGYSRGKSNDHIDFGDKYITFDR